jgi:protein-disulfide isomerase
MKFAATVVLLSNIGILTAQGPLVEGDPKSQVRVVVYEDLQCPDCAVYRKMLDDQLLSKFGSKIAFEHRDFPLAKHKWARKAAIASRFFEVNKPEAAIPFRQMVMAEQKKIDPENFNTRLGEFAKDHGVEPTKAIAALDDPKLAKLVEDDYQEGIARGVSKTPTVFVNGEPFVEHFEVDEIAKAIQSALDKAKR